MLILCQISHGCVLIAVQAAAVASSDKENIGSVRIAARLCRWVPRGFNADRN